MSGTPTGYDDIIFQKVPKCFSQNMAKLLIMYYTTDSDSLELKFFRQPGYSAQLKYPKPKYENAQVYYSYTLGIGSGIEYPPFNLMLIDLMPKAGPYNVKKPFSYFNFGHLVVLRLDILFSSNHNIHKSLYDLCFWASDPLIKRFQ